MLILEVNYKNKSYLMHVNIHESRTQQILENIKENNIYLTFEEID